ncbi:MAG: bifunctional tetrahydrofolate synthase/dihydrofolate synthase [Gammaproteobacteria bacterium]
MARFASLHEWLSWQETLHAKPIDLGLDRCRPVVERMGLGNTRLPIVTVAGTNGKGSAVAMLEAILQAAGYRTGAYTSPHLVRYNERIRVAGAEVDDATIMAAFERIDRVRGPTSLTYFEFATLAAMDIFHRMRLDVAILEVGLGGRLDAVNLFDADVALVTTVDIDHVRWLGPDRESIGREKAGIFRPHHPAVLGDARPVASLEQYAKELATPLYRLGVEFTCSTHERGWDWVSQAGVLRALPRPALVGSFQVANAAAVLMALTLLCQRRTALKVPAAAIRQGLAAVRLPGRFQILEGRPERVLDVAHNPQAAETLAEMLRQRRCHGRTLVVLAMLADKDLAGVVAPLQGVSQMWYVASLHVGRGASAAVLVATIQQAQARACVYAFDTVTEAYRAAVADAAVEDRVVVLGSFYAVGEILQLERDASATAAVGS